MTTLPPTRRELTWIVDGDADATLKNLAHAIEVGGLDEIGRLRAAWLLRRLADNYGSHLATRLAEQLAELGYAPPALDIVALRYCIGEYARNATRGALGRLAACAGLHPADVSKFRAGSSLTPEKAECLAAALIATGATRAVATPAAGPAPPSLRRMPPDAPFSPETIGALHRRLGEAFEHRTQPWRSDNEHDRI